MIEMRTVSENAIMKENENENVSETESEKEKENVNGIGIGIGIDTWSRPSYFSHSVYFCYFFVHCTVVSVGEQEGFEGFVFQFTHVHIISTKVLMSYPMSYGRNSKKPPTL